MSPVANSSQQRRLGLAALVVGYVCHFAASLLLPEWRYLSIIFWFIALGGGALYCAETLKGLHR
jgi:hypothetical protein